MITTLTTAFAKWMNIDEEKFTTKYNWARYLFTLIEKPNKIDMERLEEIGEKVSKDIPLPLYLLDARVNPLKSEFRTMNHEVTFSYMPKGGRSQTITLSQDQIQVALCKAICECGILVMKNIKRYQLEVTVNDDEEPSKDSSVAKRLFG